MTIAVIMSIITTMTMKSMSIITIMRIMTTTSMSITMTMERAAPAAAMTTIMKSMSIITTMIMTIMSITMTMEILKTLSEDDSYGMILRAKGMLESEDGVWTYFDMVPEEVDIREGSAEYTGRICVIGSKLDEAKLEQLWFAK